MDSVIPYPLWSDVRVGLESAYWVDASTFNPYVLETPVFFDNGNYVIPADPPNTPLVPREGFWVYNKRSESVVLFFRRFAAKPGFEAPSEPVWLPFAGNGIEPPPLPEAGIGPASESSGSSSLCGSVGVDLMLPLLALFLLRRRRTR